MSYYFFPALGRRSRSILIMKPEAFNDPPRRFFCPVCNHIVELKFVKIVNYCECFFLDCCANETQTIKLACSRCNFKFASKNFETCINCLVSTNFSAQICPKCGNKNRIKVNLEQ